MLLSPVHTSRHVPSIAFLMQTLTGIIYWFILLTRGAGRRWRWGSRAPWSASSLEVARRIDFSRHLVRGHDRRGLSLLPARDPRYILLAAPAFVLAAAIGVAAAVQRWWPLGPEWQTAVLTGALVVGFWYAARVPVPQVSGFREIALYLEKEAPHDAVLYDGPNSALLGFYVRALDPNFERRVTEGGQFCTHNGPGRTFAQWSQTSNVASTQDVVRLLRTRCGCRWVAVEPWSQTAAVTGRQLLRQAVAQVDFELVRSFLSRARLRRSRSICIDWLVTSARRCAGPVVPVLQQSRIPRRCPNHSLNGRDLLAAAHALVSCISPTPHQLLRSFKARGVIAHQRRVWIRLECFRVAPVFCGSLISTRLVRPPQPLESGNRPGI